MSKESTTGEEHPGISDLDETVDAADRDTRIDEDEGDDLPVTPPEQQPRASEANDSGDASPGETIEARIAQEVPDPNSAYGAPDNESGLDGPPLVGGDDPDAIPADEDFLGGGVALDRAGDAPAEESALRVESDETI